MQEVSGDAGREAHGPDGFDADLYLASNPDLRVAFDRGLIGSALEHWRDAGEAETKAGARPTLLDHPPVSWTTTGGGDAAGLDRDLYLGLNPDLVHALGEDQRGAAAHWRAFGAVEGRPCFGAPAPWDRAFGTRAKGGASPPAAGCDLFVDADPHAGEEAAIGRRILAALRAVSCPISLRAYTSRGGRLVLEAGGAGWTPTYGVTLIVASPSLCRQILATLGPDGPADRPVLGCFARAPLHRHMPDWLVMSTLDAVLVPAGPEAGLCRAVAPVPVHAVAIAPVRLAPRAAARRALGLRDTDLVIVEEYTRGDTGQDDLRAVVLPGDRARAPLPRRADQIDDVPDPWTGASRLLAAADRFEPAWRGRATRRADATASGLCEGPAPPSRADAGRGLVGLFGAIRGVARGAASLPVPARPAVGTSAARDAPVLSLLIDAEHVPPSLVARLATQTWGFFELCVAHPGAVGFEIRRAGADPRIRLVGSDRAHSALSGALAVATGTHLLPVHDVSEAARIADGLDAIAARLMAADRPELLVEAAHAAELGGGTDGVAAHDPGPLAVRDRIESALTSPIAVSRAAFDRVGGAAFLGRNRDRGYGLTLALIRAGVTIGAVALPGRAPIGDPKATLAGERALRAHLVAVAGSASGVEPGFLPATFRIRRYAARRLPVAVVALATADGIRDMVAALDTEIVLLVTAAIRPPDPDALAGLAEILADPGVGGVCPVVLAADLTIAEAGLIARSDGTLASCEEAGWMLDRAGPGQRALQVRNVHAGALCLATRRSLLREFAPEIAGGAGTLVAVSLALGRAGLRLVATPFARVRLLSERADCSGVAGRAQEVGDGWPSGLWQRS